MSSAMDLWSRFGGSFSPQQRACRWNLTGQRTIWIITCTLAGMETGQGIRPDQQQQQQQQHLGKQRSILDHVKSVWSSYIFPLILATTIITKLSTILSREVLCKRLENYSLARCLRYTQHGDHLDTKQMKYKWHLLNLLLFFPTVLGQQV